MTYNIPVVLGTARKNRKSEAAAHFVAAVLNERDNITAPLVDVRDHIYDATTPPWGDGGAHEEPTEWQNTMDAADGLVLVVPEYNHGYPGELKMLLDSLMKEYEKKPVSICGVSAGGLGGARVVEHIKPVLVELKMVPTRTAVYFSKAGDLFADDGTIKTEHEGSQRKQINGMLDELLWYAHALRVAK